MSLYGCQLWNFESVCVNKFYVAWRKCCRRLLDVPYKTHSGLVHLLCDDEDVDVQLHCRQLKVIKNCLNSENTIIRLCGQLAINMAVSLMFPVVSTISVIFITLTSIALTRTISVSK